jgi:hypothetical protein
MVVKGSVLTDLNNRVNHTMAVYKWLYSISMVVHSIVICLLCYISSSQLVNITGAVLFHLGMTWTDAVVVASMTGFIYLPVILMWAFSRGNTLLTWVNVICFTGITFVAAWLTGALV